MSTRNLPWGKVRPALKAHNLTVISEPIVYKMWEPRRLTTLWTSTACYRDRFTFFMDVRPRVSLIYKENQKLEFTKWECRDSDGTKAPGFLGYAYTSWLIGLQFVFSFVVPHVTNLDIHVLYMPIYIFAKLFTLNALHDHKLFLL
jgi:hypothetical protein